MVGGLLGIREFEILRRCRKAPQDWNCLNVVVREKASGRVLEYKIHFYRRTNGWYDEVRYDSHEIRRGRKNASPHMHIIFPMGRAAGGRRHRKTWTESRGAVFAHDLHFSPIFLGAVYSGRRWEVKTGYVYFRISWRISLNRSNSGSLWIKVAA